MRRGLRSRGRHRAARARLSTLQRLGAGAVLLGATGLGAVALSGSAAADAPMQTGWWSVSSPAPSPTTPEGGLHLAVEPGSISSYGALLFTFPQGATGTLELQIAHSAATPVIDPNSPGSTEPAMRVFACPVTSTSWKAGDNQPMDGTAPKYDCSVSKVLGNLSADGKTLTFLLDDHGQTAPGQLNVALVPGTTKDAPGVGTELPAESTQPYSLDIDKPSATALMVTSSASTTPTSTGPAGTGTGTATTSSTTGGTGGAGASGGGGISVPADLGGGETTTQSSADTGAPPVVAPSDTSAAPASAPVAAATPAKNDRAHNAALAMLVLIGLGIAAMSNGQLQRSPRLLGGGRHAARNPALVGAGAAAVTAAPGQPEPAMAAMMAPYGVRGLGRFTKPRSTPPRPLI